MSKVYLSLGTNLGNKAENLRQAVRKITEQIGDLVSLSAFYATEPWGFSSEHTFLNAAICIETGLDPYAVLHRTKEIERDLGRKHKSANRVYSDRLIDIDLLIYEQVSLQEEELTLPHPLMAERLFVMEPLAEIAPHLIHPTMNKTIGQLQEELKEKEKRISPKTEWICSI
ncbi:MAG: 2-amino-4-hydroxy-6-hydroxymethyldihydropteridine diphosphokinase [Bacteroidia bacterium]|nr:2-amino-4-hydroxy-6-hydroxymethyldihydropteridine diphosphokinase [Bacteroidia bacterium]